MNGSRIPPGLGPQAQELVDPRAAGAFVNAAQFRQGLGELEERTMQRFSALEAAFKSGDPRVAELVRAQAAGGLAGPGNGLGSCPGVLTELAQAFRTGCCIPDFLIIDIPVPKGVVGQAANAIITDSSGPNIVSEIGIYARISPTDPDAADFGKSLIVPPPTSCPTGASPCPPELLFTCPGPSGVGGTVLLPSYDVRGASIPVGSKKVRALCCGTQQCSVAVKDPGTGDVVNFQAAVPILVPDHPEALDAEVEFFTNNAAWQFAPIPADFFEKLFSITEQRPDCMGMCGYIACLQQLTAALNILRAPRFDLEVKVVLAGFRIVSCGSGLCNVAGS